VRVYVNADLCQGHTLCNMVAPEVFHLRESDGHAFVAVTVFDDNVMAAGRRAAATCPEQAIVVED
jgi:ferredoxin